MVSRTVLILAGGFGARLGAQRVGDAIAQGLREVDPSLEIDICQMGPGLAGDFDSRLRGARAVAIAELWPGPLALPADAALEAATRARQAGVPAYAVTGSGDIDAFQARMLDLQVVLHARSVKELNAAGRTLAELI